MMHFNLSDVTKAIGAKYEACGYDRPERKEALAESYITAIIADAEGHMRAVESPKPFELKPGAIMEPDLRLAQKAAVFDQIAEWSDEWTRRAANQTSANKGIIELGYAERICDLIDKKRQKWNELPPLTWKITAFDRIAKWCDERKETAKTGGYTEKIESAITFWEEVSIFVDSARQEWSES